ncbi:hypothetical protein CF65_02546 [Aggregatibacter actinomycetemcomitans HK1651]|nr:hypothetical protein CF65_02546 [Aggregatibacter actinomycetemcomitans HK1651]
MKHKNTYFLDRTFHSASASIKNIYCQELTFPFSTLTLHKGFNLLFSLI